MAAAPWKMARNPATALNSRKATILRTDIEAKVVQELEVLPEERPNGEEKLAFVALSVLIHS